MEHVRALAERLGSYANHLRREIDETTNIGDLNTADLLTEIGRSAEKYLYFLEAHLQE